LKDINKNSLKSILDLVELEIRSDNEKISTAFATSFLFWGWKAVKTGWSLSPI